MLALCGRCLASTTPPNLAALTHCTVLPSLPVEPSVSCIRMCQVTQCNGRLADLTASDCCLQLTQFYPTACLTHHADWFCDWWQTELVWLPSICCCCFCFFSCLHQLPPEPKMESHISKPRPCGKFPRVYTRTKRYCLYCCLFACLSCIVLFGLMTTRLNKYYYCYCLSVQDVSSYCQDRVQNN